MVRVGRQSLGSGSGVTRAANSTPLGVVLSVAVARGRGEGAL